MTDPVSLGFSLLWSALFRDTSRAASCCDSCLAHAPASQTARAGKTGRILTQRLQNAHIDKPHMAAREGGHSHNTLHTPLSPFRSLTLTLSVCLSHKDLSDLSLIHTNTHISPTTSQSTTTIFVLNIHRTNQALAPQTMERRNTMFSVSYK